MRKSADGGGKIGAVLREYFLITAGVFVYVVAWTSFLIPNNIASGGLTGLCTIIQFATRGVIPVAYSFPVINACLIIVATIILGRGFGFRTIYAIIVSTVLFEVMPKADFLLAVEGHPLYVSERVLIPVIGGLLEACGISLILQNGGSTGGTDIIAMIVNKFWPISPGKIYVYCDLFIISSILLLPGKTFQDMVYGYIAMIVFSVMVDFLLLGRKSSVQVLVFSEHYSEIADYMIREMDRGVTALHAVGWYTKNEREVLLILVRKIELGELTKAIKKIDRKAFVSVSPASGVFGEGFEEMKTGIERKKRISAKKEE